MFERELDALPTVTRVEKHGVKISVPGRNPTWTEATADGATFRFDIGTEQPVSCTVILKPADPAFVLFKALSIVDQKVEIISQRTVSITAPDGRVVWVYEVGYHVQQDGKKAAGHYKAAWIDDHTRPILCEHDEPGYLETFARISTRMATDYDVSSTSPPETVEIWARRNQLYVDAARTKKDVVPTGFERISTWTEGGMTVLERRSSSLLQLLEGAWQAVEVLETTRSRPDGGLHSGLFVALENNVIMRKVEVGPPKNGAHPITWIEGDGKEQRGHLAIPPRGLSVAEPNLWARRGAQGLKRTVFAPEVAPAEVLGLELLPRKGDQVVAVMDSWSADYTLADDGKPQRRQWINTAPLVKPLLTVGDDLVVYRKGR